MKTFNGKNAIRLVLHNVKLVFCHFTLWIKPVFSIGNDKGHAAALS